MIVETIEIEYTNTRLASSTCLLCGFGKYCALQSSGLFLFISKIQTPNTEQGARLEPPRTRMV